jgi:hypothetical protein
VLRKLYVRNLVLADGPLAQGFVEFVEQHYLVISHPDELVLHLKIVNKFVSHFQEVVNRFDEFLSMSLHEVCLVGLEHEVLVEFASLLGEEPSDHFYLRISSEQIRVFKLCSIFGVVPHKKLSQVNAGVESVSNALVNLVYRQLKTEINTI